MSTRPTDPDPVEDLLPALESADAFERLSAFRRMEELVHRDFGFKWDGSKEERERAVERIRNWCTEERRRRQRRKNVQGEDVTTLDLAALKALPPGKIQAHIKALLAKAQIAAAFGLARPRCESCRRRPSTVEVVVPTPGTVEVTRLCDPCASRRGEFRS
jgi:hypothetical protein